MVIRDAARSDARRPLQRGEREFLAAAAEQADQASQQGRVIDSANFLAQNMGKVPVLSIPLIIGRLPDNSEAAALMASTSRVSRCSLEPWLS